MDIFVTDKDSFKLQQIKHLNIIVYPAIFVGEQEKIPFYIRE